MKTKVNSFRKTAETLCGKSERSDDRFVGVGF